MISRSILPFFLINLIIFRLEIPTPSLDISTMIIQFLFTLIYCRHMLFHRPELCWLCQSSMSCIFFHFQFSQHLLYIESVHSSPNSTFCSSFSKIKSFLEKISYSYLFSFYSLTPLPICSSYVYVIWKRT